MTAQIHSMDKELESESEPKTIRVVEGWMGNWYISLRRHDIGREERAAYHLYRTGTGV